MRIARMTIVLPARLRSMAEHEARRIAGEAAATLSRGEAPRSAAIRVEVAGQGLSGAALSGAVARGIATRPSGGKGGL